MRAPVLVLLVACFFVPAACAPLVGDPVAGSVSGVVTVGNGVAEAQVTAYRVDDDGRRSVPLGSARSESDGAFTIGVGAHTGALLVCATGGRFVDLATGLVVAQGAHELCALVPAFALGGEASAVVVSPWSSLHAATTACFKESGREPGIVPAADRAAFRWNDFLAAGLDGFELMVAPEALAGSVADGVNGEDRAGDAASVTPSRWHGLLLAGLSESARVMALESGIDPGARVTVASLTAELVRDLDDGSCVLDGKARGVALAQGDVALSSDTLRGGRLGLAQAIASFAAGRPGAAPSAGSIEDLLAALSAHESELFGPSGGFDLGGPVVSFVAPSVGPVFGTAPIEVTAEDVSGVVELAFAEPAALVGTGVVACESDAGVGRRCTLSGTLNTALLAVGDVVLTARAKDGAGNTTTTSITVTINNSVPAITVASPAAGVVSGVVALQAAVSDPDGVASFTVLVPGAVLAAQCAPPLLLRDCDQAPDISALDVLLDTASLPEGPLTLTFQATDALSNASFQEVLVEVDNIAAGVVRGVVELGAPIEGATVTLSSSIDGTAEAVIGTAVTDEEGRYEIENGVAVGNLLVTVRGENGGGTFVDPSTGQQLSLRDGHMLQTALIDVEGGEVRIANVNAWTTLVAARSAAVMREAEAQDTIDSVAGVDEETEEARAAAFAASVQHSGELFSQHLLRPGSLSLATSSSADLLLQQPAPSDASALLALTHGGLSRLAAQVSIDVGGVPGQVTLVDLVDVLARDLSDLVLDGRDGDTPLFLDGATYPSNSQVVRTMLAEKVDAYVKNAPFRHDGLIVQEGVVDTDRMLAGTITSSALAGPGLLYDDLAEDRSILFPGNEPVVAFDRQPPSVVLSFGSPHEGESSGAALVGTVAIMGGALDHSAVASFTVIEPSAVDVYSGVRDLRIELDGHVAPNASKAARACGHDEASVQSELIDPARSVCACAEAKDELQNTAYALLCFTRPPPVVTTDLPAYVGHSVASVRVQVEGSFALETCEAAFEQAVLGVGLSVLAGTVDGVFCEIDLPLASELLDGEALLRVRGTEIGGRPFSSTQRFIVDKTAPVVSITAPVANDFFREVPGMAARVVDASPVSVERVVVASGAPVVRDTASSIGADGVAAFSSFEDTLPDGLRTVTFTARDEAGNEGSAVVGYTKDTTPPVLAPPALSDGNPLAFFPLTSNMPYSPSSGCFVFPYADCVFDAPASTASQDVVFRGSADVADTYRRWQHLVGAATNPLSSGSTSSRAEARAPTLRMKTEPSSRVEVRIDASCPDEATFLAQPRAMHGATELGVFDLPIIEGAQLPNGAIPLRAQRGSQVLCLSMQAVDRAGNRGPLSHHFFRYEATAAPVLILYNLGPYPPASYQEDMASFDNAHDDLVLSGSGQGASGRVFSHAYVVSPSSSSPANYSMSLSGTASPVIEVAHAQTLQISRTRAFDWCHAAASGDDFANPDFLPVEVAGTALDRPIWDGDSLGARSSGPSWTLFVPHGENLSAAHGAVEHRARLPGESDRTPHVAPADSYSTTEHTTVRGPQSRYLIPLAQVTLEAWTVNGLTGLPVTLLDAGSAVDFSAGGGSSRVRLLLFRAPVPQNALTLKTAAHLNGQLGTLSFNDPCFTKDSAGRLMNQGVKLADGHFVVTDQAIPGVTNEPVSPHALLWVASGQFAYCDGTSSRDCRFGRYFEDYLGAAVKWPAGRSIAVSGQISGVSDAAWSLVGAMPIPEGVVRTLGQEP